jgi:hypothetical protein
MPGTRITDTELKNMFDNLPDIARSTGVMESLALGSFIVRKFLSNEWANKHIVPGGGRTGFLTIDESTPERREVTFYRVIDLAEILVNLQNVPGFDDCLGGLRKGDLEGTYAELDLGRMLYAYKANFKYIRRHGVRGEDYDVEVTYPDGLVACTEAKCKIEATQFHADTVRDSLNRACGQLPANRPGIAFVKVPQQWMPNPSFGPELRRVAREFLADNSNVVSVKYYVSNLSFEHGNMRHQHAYEEINNPTNAFDPGRNWSLFYRLNPPAEWNGMPPHWKRVLFYPDGKPRRESCADA